MNLEGMPPIEDREVLRKYSGFEVRGQKSFAMM